MKVNAPEKIYVQLPSRNWIGRTWNETPIKDGDNPNWKNATNIEYISKDAFIEKACDFFEENIEEEDCKIGSSEWVELRAEYKSLDSFIRAFVEYMKGE